MKVPEFNALALYFKAVLDFRLKLCAASIQAIYTVHVNTILV